MTSRRQLIALAALMLPLFAAGCGKPSMVPVQGKITYWKYDRDGRQVWVPVTNGVVVFAPDTRGPIAVGRIREDGSYALYTGDYPGVYPGSYRVTVSSMAPNYSSETYGRFEYPRTGTPDRYREVDRSGLTCDVKPNFAHTLNFVLND